MSLAKAHILINVQDNPVLFSFWGGVLSFLRQGRSFDKVRVFLLPVQGRSRVNAGDGTDGLTEGRDQGEATVT